jgi:hypothetical protein
MFAAEFNRWTLTELPRLNRAILAGAQSPEALVRRLASAALIGLPPPESMSPTEANQLMVLLGLAGASVARHYQEQDLTRKATPDRAFTPLRVGPDGIPFLDYFSRLASATGTGHPDRDSYASLVRWNAPATEVRVAGIVVAGLPGAFADGMIRTYTNDSGEFAFFALLKKSEALELAANDLLQPISDGTIDILSADATDRARLATLVLRALRRLNLDFASAPVSDGGLRTEHFMDVFRQFAVHWAPGDLPPSGAQDPEFLRRDLLLGLDFAGYDRQVLRIMPTLLDSDRVMLTRLLGAPALPMVLLRSLHLDREGMTTLSTSQLRDLVSGRPELGVWYLLLAANAKFAATHLMLTEKFLFRPQRERDATGVGDRLLVSNREGTTGLAHPVLEQLTRARRRHALTTLARVPAPELARLCGLPPTPPITSEDVAGMVQFSTQFGNDGQALYSEMCYS